MSHVRRAVACAGTLAVTLCSFALATPTAAHAVEPASQTTADAGVAWLKTQQQPDGGFEVAAFPGFETLDAALAIAETAQTSDSWSPSEAIAAIDAVQYGGSGPTPFDAIDAYAATIPTLGASAPGIAAKNIVLGAAPYGFDPAAFDPAANGNPVDLVSLMGGCSATGGSTFNFTLYVALAQHLVCSAPSADAVQAIRGAQQANGGWNFIGDPTGADIDPDSTALAVEALVGAGADPTDPAVHAALGFFATNQQTNGSWQSFGSDDPNSTAVSMFAITAAGYDADSPCWRDTVDPSLAGTAYAGPSAWLRAQQLTSPAADAGRIASPNDPYGINTFPTSQTIEGLLLRWMPVARAATQTCDAPATPPPAVSPETVATPAAPATAVVSATPRFTG